MSLRERILREADLDGQVKRACRDLEPEIQRHARTLDQRIREDFAKRHADPWTAPIDQLAAHLITQYGRAA